MNTLQKLFFVIVASVLASFAAVAQQPGTPQGIAGASSAAVSTVGELIGGGGKKLTKDELTKLVKGTTISGTLPSNPAWGSEKTYKDDGSLTGRNYSLDGASRSAGVFGKWTINDRAELCVDLQQTYSVGTHYTSCTFFFKLGTAYYFAVNDDENTPAYIREIKSKR